MVEAVDIEFDVNDVSHQFVGFGAQVWPGDMRVGTVFADLHIKYIRMCPGGCSSPPTDATQVQMDAYVDSEYNGTNRGDNIIASLQMADGLDIQVILNMFGGPAAWLGTNNRLKSENLDDFARLWASQVYFFKSRGLRVNYIELANEPEGDWNIYIPGADYNTVVKLVRQELDSRGLTDVGIVGPGLAYLYHGPTWIGALDSDGRAALACWSTHAWDEGWGHTDALPSFLDQRWQDYFGDAVNSVDPTHSKPIIVTEYATGVRTYNGIMYGDDFTETNQFAQRCYENSLTLVNNGANVLCYWEAANQSWQTSPPWYGFLRIDSSLRTVYYALLTLAPHIPDDAMVIRKTWDDPVISAAGFIGDNDNKLVLAFANSSPFTANRTVGVTGVTSLIVTSAQAFESGTVIDKLSQISFDYGSSSMDVNLAPESTLTIIAVVNECTIKSMGDVDGDCSTTLGDYSMVAADWLTDNNVPELEVIEDFESYTDDFGLQAAWVMNLSSDITGETLVNDPGVLNGSNCMLITTDGQGPAYYAQTKLALPGAVHNDHGVNLTGYDTISMTFAIPPDGSTPPWENLGGTGGIVFLSMFDCWGMKVFGANYAAGSPTPSGTGWPSGIVWELDFATYTESGQNLENVEQITVGYSNCWYGPGALFVDDIVVYDSSSLVCSEEPAGDVNQDCKVDFDDILAISENWLKCTLIEN
ncbi:MAG: hypothetical protein PVG93_00055 [Phycisphaerales bacterium]|jgi:hypothetical protein